jgi:Zn-dependent peptidase ImmA (M78 family)
MTLRRGFKTEANWYAREMRRELGLIPESPLCPWRLASHLEFPVFGLTEFKEIIPEEIAFFRSIAGQKAFSAVTLFVGSKRCIVHNDAHSLKRQAANIAHELAHGLLLHPPKPPFDVKGSRHYDAVLEAEANWLGPALLISDEAALFIVRSKQSVLEASDQYGVSAELVRMRLNTSGAAIRIARQRVA